VFDLSSFTDSHPDSGCCIPPLREVPHETKGWGVRLELEEPSPDRLETNPPTRNRVLWRTTRISSGWFEIRFRRSLASNQAAGCSHSFRPHSLLSTSSSSTSFYSSSPNLLLLFTPQPPSSTSSRSFLSSDSSSPSGESIPFAGLSPRSLPARRCRVFSSLSDTVRSNTVSHSG